MAEMLEMGKVSSRGQIAIPVGIRQEMGLKEGSRVLFFLENDALLVKKLSSETWESITRPLRERRKKIAQAEVDNLVHRLRK